MAAKLGREPIYDTPLEDGDIRVLVTSSQKAEIYEYARQANIKKAGPFLRSLGLNEIRHPAATEPPVNKNQILFELSERDHEELEKLAEALYHDDPNIFMKSLAKAAIDAGPAAVRKLMYGRADEEVEARMEADTSKKTTTRSRKAA